MLLVLIIISKSFETFLDVDLWISRTPVWTPFGHEGGNPGRESWRGAASAAAAATSQEDFSSSSSPFQGNCLPQKASWPTRAFVSVHFRSFQFALIHWAPPGQRRAVGRLLFTPPLGHWSSISSFTCNQGKRSSQSVSVNVAKSDPLPSPPSSLHFFLLLRLLILLLPFYLYPIFSFTFFYFSLCFFSFSCSSFSLFFSILSPFPFFLFPFLPMTFPTFSLFFPLLHLFLLLWPPLLFLVPLFLSFFCFPSVSSRLHPSGSISRKSTVEEQWLNCTCARVAFQRFRFNKTQSRIML